MRRDVNYHRKENFATIGALYRPPPVFIPALIPMNHLWSPWRMTYIQNDLKNPGSGCVFCAAQELPNGAENLIVHRGAHAFVILNRYPYTTGHLMVVPNIHEADLEALEEAARSEMMALAAQAIRVLRAVYHPQGFNVGMNLGRVAGAGIAEHLHMHIVPRWGGDTNFMSSIGQTRVLPEALEDTYQRVRNAWESA